MCLVLVAWKAHPRYKCIILANRDEFVERPTQNMYFWEEDKNLLAGKDKVAGGTWFGIHKKRGFATLTNYREACGIGSKKKSRGTLIKDFLLGKDSLDEYTERINPNDFQGFNLLFSDWHSLLYYSNKTKKSRKIEAGIYVLSNAFLDTPWEKCVRVKAKFRDYISKSKESKDNWDLDTKFFFEIMSDNMPSPDELLPDTGIGKEKEKQLSSPFISLENYGTLNTSIMLLDYYGSCKVIDRIYSRIYNKVYNKIYKGKYHTNNYFQFNI